MVKKICKLLISVYTIVSVFAFNCFGANAASIKVVQNKFKTLDYIGKYTMSVAGSTNTWGCEDYIHGQKPRSTPYRLSGDNGGRNLGKAPDGQPYGQGGNSSSSNLKKPTTNAKIYKAFLVVEATSYSADSSKVLATNPVKFVAPNGSSIRPTALDSTVYSIMQPGLSSQELWWRTSSVIHDVTDFVKANGYGSYQVWDIPYYPDINFTGGGDMNASWKLIVISEDEATPLRKLQLQLGCQNVTQEGVMSKISGNGIKTKSSGNVTGQVVIGGMGGDPDYYGTIFKYSPNPNVGMYKLGTYSKSTGKYPNRENQFFEGVSTVNGESLSGSAVVGYRDSDNYAFHNNDLILMDVNSSKSMTGNGHNAYFTNNSNEVKLWSTSDGKVSSTLTVFGLSADIDVATYKSYIHHSGTVYEGVPFSMNASVENTTTINKPNLGVQNGRVILTVDSNITIDGTSIQATFTDKSEGGKKYTLPKSMISQSGNTITVTFGKNSKGISQKGDIIDITFKGTPKKESQVKNTIEMTANSFIDEVGNVNAQSSTFTLTSSEDSFSVMRRYYLDVNGLLDGTGAGNTKGFGTFDVYINGSLVGDNVTDWYQKYPNGTNYEIKNIEPYIGKEYNGVSSGSIKGVIGKDTNVQLKFSTCTYTITYKGNGGTWSNTDTWSQKVTYDEDYVTKENFFDRPGYQFVGWNEKVDGSGADWTDLIGKPWKWTKTSNVTLYAQWFNRPPKPPIIVPPIDPPETNSNIPPYLDGNSLIVQKGDPFNPLDYVKAEDEEDGDITDRITVKENPIPYDKNNNTSEAGEYVVIVQVTDNGGETTEAEINVIVNDKPLIAVQDRWFFINEPVDSTAILEKAEAFDKEDGDITDKINIISIKNISGEELEKDKIDTTQAGIYFVTYEVTDKYKASNTCTAKVNVVDKDIAIENYSLRYISKEHLNTLNSSSNWKRQAELFNSLSSSLNKEATDDNAIYVIEFDSQKSEEMENYILNNEQNENFNSDFINQFSEILKKRPNDGNSRKN